MDSRKPPKRPMRLCAAVLIAVCCVMAARSDAAVYRCPGTDGSALFTDLGCVAGHPVALGSLAGRIDPLTEAEAAALARLAEQARSSRPREARDRAARPAAGKRECKRATAGCGSARRSTSQRPSLDRAATRAAEDASPPQPPRRARLPHRRSASESAPKRRSQNQ